MFSTGMCTFLVFSLTLCALQTQAQSVPDSVLLMTIPHNSVLRLRVAVYKADTVYVVTRRLDPARHSRHQLLINERQSILPTGYQPEVWDAQGRRLPAQRNKDLRFLPRQLTGEELKKLFHNHKH